MAVQAYDEEKVSFSDVSQSVQNAFVLSICVSKYDGSGNDLPDVKVDQNIVNSLFSDVYNYDVTNNLGTEYVSFSELNGYLRRAQHKLRRNDEGYDAFILVLSGHGNKGTFYTSDLAQVSIESIQERFYGDNLPNFVNLPKIFVVDACRGNKNIRPVETKSLSLTESYHTGQQFTVLYGNVLGFTTIATKNGSILIQSLDKVLRQVASSIDKPNDNNNLNEISMGMRFYVLAMSDAKMIVDRNETMISRTRLFVSSSTKKEKAVKALKSLKATQYSISIYNQSGSNATIGIFQSDPSNPDTGSPIVFASVGVANNGMNMGTWSLDWGLSYGSTTTSANQVVFYGRGAIIPVDPTGANNNGAILSYDATNKVWNMASTRYDLQAGDISTVSDGSFTKPQAMEQRMNVSVTIDGSAVFAMDGIPNNVYTFHTHPTYYLSTTMTQTGIMVSGDAIGLSTQAIFSDGIFHLDFTLNIHNQIIPGKPTN